MKTNGSFPTLIFLVITGVGALLGFGLHAGHEYLAFVVFGIAIFLSPMPDGVAPNSVAPNGHVAAA